MTTVFRGHLALVGPIGVGKTPVAEMIADRLKIDHVMLDMVEEYRYQVGWRDDESFRRLEQKGYLAKFAYDAQFSVPLIQLVMEEFPSAVIDCGGDDLVGWTDEQREEIKNGLAALGLKHIAALLPFSDIEKTQ